MTKGGFHKRIADTYLKQVKALTKDNFEKATKTNAPHKNSNKTSTY